MIMPQEQALLTAPKEFDALCQWVGSIKELRIDEVERQLLGRLLAIEGAKEAGAYSGTTG